jgi:hypothetical protein
MPIGPGKYDAECSGVRTKTQARGTFLIVIEGDRGSGFSCTSEIGVLLTLPALLRSMADSIEADLKKGKL